jgi:hypothetical protein
LEHLCAEDYSVRKNHPQHKETRSQ